MRTGKDLVRNSGRTSPFVYQNAAKYLWPIDKGFADYAKGCYYVINVGELEDAMRYSLKTINPDGRVDNFFTINAPWGARNVLAARQFRGHSCRPSL